MRKILGVLSLLAASSLAAQAEDKPFWKSPLPTGRVTNQNGMVVEYCYTTKFLTDGHKYYNPMDCRTPNIRNYVSMSWPLDGPVVNMGSYREATRAKILPNGHIKLY